MDDMIKEQISIANRAILYDVNKLPNNFYIAGLDIGFDKIELHKGCVGIVILEYPSLKSIYSNYEEIILDMNYISGFLAFREIKHYLNILSKVPKEIYPSIILVDGNGILHKRKCGIATHLGVLIDMPTIGVAKTLYNHDNILINDKNEMIGQSGTIWGKVIRLPKNKKEVYVSIGHKISLETASEIVKNCCICKIPEPIRLTDNGCRKFLSNLKRLIK